MTDHQHRQRFVIRALLCIYTAWFCFVLGVVAIDLFAVVTRSAALPAQYIYASILMVVLGFLTIRQIDGDKNYFGPN